LSGWQNLRFFVSLSGDVSDARFREVVELVGLTERIHDPVTHYSHGMRQRLALAQALLPDPEFILLDEPTEGLDPAGIHEMRAMIRKLRDEHGLTVMLSSHLLSEVEQLCDRVAILDGGKLVFSGAWRSGPPRWKLSLDDQATARDVLDRYITERDGDVVILREGMDIADLVSALVHAGVRVRGVELLRATLEDFYLGRTRP
jgi:ABC-2 type transport system ATP-binding protein